MANLDLFVDDTAFQAIARDIPEILTKLRSALIKFQQIMRKLKLKEDEDGNKISDVKGIRAACKEIYDD